MYLDSLEPVGEGGPAEKDDGPGQDGPRGPEAHRVDGAEGDAGGLGGVGGNSVPVVHNGDGLDEDRAEEVGNAEVAQHQVVGQAQQRLLLPASSGTLLSAQI